MRTKAPIPIPVQRHSRRARVGLAIAAGVVILASSLAIAGLATSARHGEQGVGPNAANSRFAGP
jgi:hypothetical protein